MLTRTAISFLLIIILSAITVNAANVSLSFPDSVKLNESFDVSISIDAEGIYDVKLFVSDDSGMVISQVLSGGAWKNAFYYLKSAYPESKVFSARVNKPAEQATLCARLRKSGSSAFSEKCLPISISSSSESSGQSAEASDNPETQESAAINYSVNLSEQIITANNSPLKEEPSEPEVIYLNSPHPETTLTSYAKTRIAMVVGFSVLALVLLILLAMRKI